MRSVLLNLSSRNAVSFDRVRENGAFRVVLNNPNHINRATRVVPHKVLVPNSFDNVSNHTFVFNGTQVPAWGVADGFYDAEEYALAFANAYNTANVLGTFPSILSMALVDGYYRIQFSGTGTSAYVVGSAESWRVSGFLSRTEPVSGQPNLRGLSITPNMILNDNPAPGSPRVNPTNPPNLTGVQMVYIGIKQSCQGNLISSDSSQYNILAAVPLTQTPYGSYACERAYDVELDEIFMGTVNNIQVCDIEVLNEDFKPLKVPLNHDVLVILKVFHE